MLKDEYFVSKIGVDRTANKPRKGLKTRAISKAPMVIARNSNPASNACANLAKIAISDSVEAPPRKEKVSATYVMLIDFGYYWAGRSIRVRRPCVFHTATHRNSADSGRTGISI